MAKITLKGNPIHTNGELPAVGSKAPDFRLVDKDLKDCSLLTWAGKTCAVQMFEVAFSRRMCCSRVCSVSR